VDVAFAGQTPNPDLVTLLNLEIWGLPTSNPAPDPGNGGFIYQRFQRGIMHFDASCGCTQGILVGEYLKAVITGRSLPTDLGADMQGSRFLNQYSPGSSGWVARPAVLQNTDMNGAFEPGTGPVTQPPAPPAQPTSPPAAGTATATPTPSAVGPTVTIQVDDDLIDPGQSVTVTVIARYPTAIDWIEFEGIESDNNNENDNDASNDPALARQRFDCDDRTECANVWTISPTIPGRYTLRARGRGNDDVRSEWVTTPFRVRDIGATATPSGATATPTTAAATPTATTAATATPTGRNP
jgi:cell division septation protein DedD